MTHAQLTVAQLLDSVMPHHFEGIGETSTHYIDLASPVARLTVPDRGFFRRPRTKLRFESRGMPYVNGLK